MSRRIKTQQVLLFCRIKWSAAPSSVAITVYSQSLLEEWFTAPPALRQLSSDWLAPQKFQAADGRGLMSSLDIIQTHE